MLSVSFFRDEIVTDSNDFACSFVDMTSWEVGEVKKNVVSFVAGAV